MKQFPILYKRDSKGKIREWSMEVAGNQYRTTAGLQEGQQVTTEWTTTEDKNVGRANEVTAEEQAVNEVKSQYKKKLAVDYHESVDTIDVVKIFKPMLAQGWDKRKAKIDYSNKVYFQPKLDGIRCIISRAGAYTRTGKPINTIPHIVKMLEPVFAKYPDVVFDGELYNHDLKSNFNEIISMVRKGKPTTVNLEKSARMVQYHVYDFPGMMDDTFLTRNNQLFQLVEEFGFGDSIQYVPTHLVESEAEVDKHYGEYLELGYEGGIVRLNDEYQQKRTNSLIKRKEFEDAEFTIIRIEEGQGNWAGLAKRVFFVNDLDGREVGAGMKGSKSYAKHVLENAESYIGKQATIQFFTRTPDGVPRFPIAKVLHEDKRW